MLIELTFRKYMKYMTLNKDGKRIGWDFQYIEHQGRKCRYGIPVFYENGIATKIQGNFGEYDFDIVKHSRYILLRAELIHCVNAKKEPMYSLKEMETSTFDVEFLKQALPYKDCSYNNKEPKKLIFF